MIQTRAQINTATMAGMFGGGGFEDRFAGGGFMASQQDQGGAGSGGKVGAECAGEAARTVAALASLSHECMDTLEQGTSKLARGPGAPFPRRSRHSMRSKRRSARGSPPAAPARPRAGPAAEGPDAPRCDHPPARRGACAGWWPLGSAAGTRGAAVHARRRCAEWWADECTKLRRGHRAPCAPAPALARARLADHPPCPPCGPAGGQQRRRRARGRRRRPVQRERPSLRAAACPRSRSAPCGSRRLRAPQGHSTLPGGRRPGCLAC